MLERGNRSGFLFGGVMENDNLIFYSGEVKALGEGKVAGYLARFGTPKDVDLEGDFFDKETDFGVSQAADLPVYYQHGFDPQIKNRRIGRGVIKYDDVGLWLEAQLELRDEYEKMLYGLAEAGKLGWSSGAAGHLVEREKVGKSYYIKSWPIAEASLTPTPAEPRNSAMPVKSFYQPETQQAVDTAVVEETNSLSVEDTMTEEEIKAMLESVAAQAAETAVKAYASKEPEVKAGYDVKVIGDEADRELEGKPFSKGEFFRAVKNAAMYPSQIDKRLLPLKSNGLNEAIPSQGGFLVTPDIAAGIQQNMWGVGSVLSLFSPITVSGNGLTINAIDETSRANGSRMGGVLGYWLEEGGTKTATKPKFRQVELKLKKVIAACYATDELLEDATALESWINNNVPIELRFNVEQAIVNGNGVGKPLGMLQSPALVQAVRTDASEIDSLDISRMWSLRYPGVNDYVWLTNANTAPQLFNMTLGNYPVYLPPGGFSGAMYGSIFGRPVIETEYNPGLGTLGDIMLVSPSQYALITKGGVDSASSIHVQFMTDETTFRFVYRVDGEPTWASSVTAFASTDSISPFVALAATT